MEKVEQKSGFVKGATAPPLREYISTFVQRAPRYAVKWSGRPWSTKQKPLADRPVEAHLRGHYAVGVLGKWYPEFCIVDVDDRPRGDVDRIRESLELTESNSMLFSSESPNSYHLLLRPEFREKPPTIKLLGDAFEGFARDRGVEVYPQAGRVIRLPFGPAQTPLDLEYSRLGDWADKFYWFQKLDPFDISTVRGQQFGFDFTLPQRPAVPSILSEAGELFEHGLQSPGSRHDAQFKVIYLLWRRNVPRDTAEEMAFSWIRRRHNGFSMDIVRNPDGVLKEIQRQVARVYEKYEFGHVYPDSTHNLFNGFITRADVEWIVRVSGGSLPRMRFLFELVKFCYPRRERKYVNVHSDRLVEWSSWRTYDVYLRELEKAGILTRGSSYQTGKFAKAINIKWPFRSADNAVLYEGRAVDTFQDTVGLLFKPAEFRELLTASGVGRQWCYKVASAIWGARDDSAHYELH